MGVKQELDWLYSLHSKGIKLGLGPVRELCNRLGNPMFKSIHIAGTNGKGSVAKMLYTVLRTAGYSVGLYTSPHLVCFNERIVVDDTEISDTDIVRLISKLKATGVDATFFEFTTLMAFQYFAENGVDIAVVETGMGGRLDATNILSPILTIITRISLDHQQYLGNTIPEIAAEKAGIIKPNVPVITSNPLKPIVDTARTMHSPLIVAPRVTLVKQKPMEYQLVRLGEGHLIKTSLLGSYQLENIGMAVSACKALKPHFNINMQQIEQGINKTRWPARLEVVSRNPLIILDGSHNVDGLLNLRDFLGTKLMPIIVLGISFDKDISSMVPIIAPLAKKLILTRSSYRGAPTHVLRNIVHHPNMIEIEDVATAVRIALQDGNPVVITGSLYVAGEAKQVLDSQ